MKKEKEEGLKTLKDFEKIDANEDSSDSLCEDLSWNRKARYCVEIAKLKQEAIKQVKQIDKCILSISKKKTHPSIEGRYIYDYTPFERLKDLSRKVWSLNELFVVREYILWLNNLTEEDLKEKVD